MEHWLRTITDYRKEERPYCGGTDSTDQAKEERPHCGGTDSTDQAKEERPAGETLLAVKSCPVLKRND